MNVKEVKIEKTGKMVKINCDISGDKLVAGDIYAAKRNTGWELLTCKEVDLINGWIVPCELAYLYNLFECFKVV